MTDEVMGSETETIPPTNTAAVRPTAAEPDVSTPATAHLKLIPPVRETRLKIRLEAARMAATLDRSRPLTREALQNHATKMLRTLGLADGYLGFAMVAISNEFWREQFMAVEFKRRLLLLPHCLKQAETCPANYDSSGLNCTDCGSCIIADFKLQADKLGYRVLVAEGTPIVLKIITSGEVDAILGVACLNVLEKALDKVLKVGVPSLAVPLLSSSCTETSVDSDWVNEAVQLVAPPPPKRTRTYLPLLRAANEMFEPPALKSLVPKVRGDGGTDPVAATEMFGHEWLTLGGKRFRPFITLAAYDAMSGGHSTRPADVRTPVELPTSVLRVAMAMEVFHKASLAHDDIEDDDSYRYGRQTLHRQHGVPTAINIGDYLIGLGYRLVSGEASALGADKVADIVDRIAQAHQRLAEGQGAELYWRDAARKELAPLDALKIYALKTAPAFEAALYAGARLAGPVPRDGELEQLICEFSRNLGVAFQIINDLNDWDSDEENKRVRGQDVLSARPTLLLALALERANAEQKTELRQLIGAKRDGESGLQRVREIYDANAVFEHAEALVTKYRRRCEAVADRTAPDTLRELLRFLVDTVLEREPK